jgi:phenylpropionate dioxygenase-like ring-hydroxylating dioxygenase large terminal subunit
VETCGEVVFVNFSDNAVSLQEWLGPLWDVWQNSYGGAYRYATSWEKDFACNWKVVLENSLESYHIPLVHPKTFKEFSTEENSWHELTDTFTSYKTMTPSDMPTRMGNWMVRRLGERSTGEYWHRVRHPHITGAALDMVRLIQCVFPTGPTTCRYRTILFTLRGHKSGPFAWGLYRFLRAISVMVAHQIFDEDGTIYGGVQKGMAASPHKGVIGTREERLFHFQEYVNRACTGARELPVV